MRIQLLPLLLGGVSLAVSLVEVVSSVELLLVPVTRRGRVCDPLGIAVVNSRARSRDGTANFFNIR